MKKLLACSVVAAILAGCGGAPSESNDPTDNSNTSSRPNVSTPVASSSVAFSSAAPSSTPSNAQSSFASASSAPNPDGQSSSEGEQAEVVDESFFFFSYDDTGSTASRDLTHFYIQNGLVPLSSWGRAYEYLNAEEFDHFNSEQAGEFEVSIGLLPLTNKIEDPEIDEEQMFLGVNLSGPTLSNEERNNVVVTLLVDVSGSMDTSYARETRSDIRSLLEVTQHGLLEFSSTLKEGDVVNIVTFDTNAQVLLEGHNIIGDDRTMYESTVNNLYTRGSTNLNAGIELAYQVAQNTFDSEKSNRVIILTDAKANSGQVNPTIIANNTVIGGNEGIYFSGIGIGDEFNEAFLNELTEIGKGSYAAMITPNDSERLFTKEFARFIDDAIKNVRFKLDYPASWTHSQEASAAEETSTVETDVQPVHFAYNASQFFLEGFTTEQLDESETLTLEISFDGNDGERETLIIQKPISEILNQGQSEIEAAAMVWALAETVAGKVSCERVMQAELMSEESEHPVFTNYLSLLTQFCGDIEEEDFFLN